MKPEKLLLAGGRVEDDAESCGGVDKAAILGKLEITLGPTAAVAVCMLQPEVSGWCPGPRRLKVWRGGLLDSFQVGLVG